MSAVPLKRLCDGYRPSTCGIVQAGESAPEGVRYIRPIDMVGRKGVTRRQALAGPRRPRWPRATGGLAVETRGRRRSAIGPSFGEDHRWCEELRGSDLTQGTVRVATAPRVSPIPDLRAPDLAGGQTVRVRCRRFDDRALNLERSAATSRDSPTGAGSTQRAIADYLDTETARIDALIAKKSSTSALVIASVSRAKLERVSQRRARLDAVGRSSRLPGLSSMASDWDTWSRSPEGLTRIRPGKSCRARLRGRYLTCRQRSRRIVSTCRDVKTATDAARLVRSRCAMSCGATFSCLRAGTHDQLARRTVLRASKSRPCVLSIRLRSL